jgi:hypothetical protein
MIDNLDEMNAILTDARLAMLSVYQFYSQAGKFDNGRSSGGVSMLDDRPRNSNARTVEDFNDCVASDRPNTIEEDAQLDAHAAVIQAKEIIRQPAGTAIFLGVDFDLTKEREANVMAYFRVINKIIRNEGYALGVYGNGAISDLLRGENPTHEELIEYVWLTASPAHAGSTNTYNTKHWDLLQTKTDTKWPINDGGKLIELDTNMQNPASTYIGFWNKNGGVTVSHDRNITIHNARRFVCEGSPIVLDRPDASGHRIERPACTRTFGIVVRTFETDSTGKLVRVDCDEDGKPDGWMKVTDLSAKRPLWIDDENLRRQAHCSGHW